MKETIRRPKDSLRHATAHRRAGDALARRPATPSEAMRFAHHLILLSLCSLLSPARPAFTRRSMKQITILIALLGILGGQGLAAGGSAKPNIIFILADDLGYGDLGCFGQARIKTPHLDRMAAEGMRFTQTYSGSTVCAPSRCVLMTGRHTGHATVRGNAGRQNPLAQSLREGDTTGASTSCWWQSWGRPLACRFKVPPAPQIDAFGAGVNRQTGGPPHGS